MSVVLAVVTALAAAYRVPRHRGRRLSEWALSGTLAALAAGLALQAPAFYDAVGEAAGAPHLAQLLVDAPSPPAPRPPGPSWAAGPDQSHKPNVLRDGYRGVGKPALPPVERHAVLTHDCDDPIGVKEVEAHAIRFGTGVREYVRVLVPPVVAPGDVQYLQLALVVEHDDAHASVSLIEKINQFLVQWRRLLLRVERVDSPSPLPPTHHRTVCRSQDGRPD